MDQRPDPLSVVVAFARQVNPAILESIAADPTYGRWSVFACDPLEVLVVEQDCRDDPFEAVAARLAHYPTVENRTGLPFSGGWVGYLSYEAGARIENIAPTNPAGTTLPLMRLGLYDNAVLFDHHTGRWYALAVDWPDEAGFDRPSAEDRIEQLCKLLDSAAALELPAQAATETPKPDWRREEYIAHVLTAKKYIAAGDIYQVNLTHRFTARTDATPLRLYLNLRCANPADYAALLSWGNCAVLSSSPELFLELRDGRVITRPIKGTRPRTSDVLLNAIRRRELACSEKDRAELNMIIDLLRNDLSRVCEVGSVRVESAGELETHPTVFHRVAAITGRLRADAGAVDLLRATCPGGSITGAPKIRAMQIIDELESVQRGVYCGSIGYLGLDGNMVMNIAIRTMVAQHDQVHIHAGGAIVADSDPLEEYEESLAKAEGMFRALETRVSSALHL